MFGMKFEAPKKQENEDRSLTQEIMDLGKRITLFTGLFAASIGSLKAAESKTGEKLRGEEMHYEMFTSPQTVKGFFVDVFSKYGSKVEITNIKDMIYTVEELQNAYVFTEHNKVDNSELKCIDVDKDGDIDVTQERDPEGNVYELAFDDPKNEKLLHAKEKAQEVLQRGLKTILLSKKIEASKMAQSAPESSIPSVSL